MIVESLESWESLNDFLNSGSFWDLVVVESDLDEGCKLDVSNCKLVTSVESFLSIFSKSLFMNSEPCWEDSCDNVVSQGCLLFSISLNQELEESSHQVTVVLKEGFYEVDVLHLGWVETIILSYSSQDGKTLTEELAVFLHDWEVTELRLDGTFSDHLLEFFNWEFNLFVVSFDVVEKHLDAFSSANGGLTIKLHLFVKRYGL